MSWTEARVDILKKLWFDRLSASQIADELGGVTRNGVIGKVHRLGLVRKAKPVAPSRVRSPRMFIPRQANPITRPIAEPELVYTTEHMCRFDKLGWNSCRYPLWTDDTPFSDKFYCGTPTADPFAGKPYCAYHSQFVYTPARGPFEVSYYRKGARAA